MSTLYVVATPIGNLEDISARALRILREVQLIAAEDTRHTGKLLSHFEIKTKLTSYFEHNKLKKLDTVLNALAKGDVALVSDAGTPGLNDPGYLLVRAALDAGHTVSPIPGPSAPVAALVVSGLPSDHFLYLGYMPRKENERRRMLEEIKHFTYTLIWLESPHRIAGTLQDILAVLGDRQVAVAGELTKMFEEVFRGSAQEALDQLAEHPARGEYTLVVAGHSGEKETWTEAELRLAVVDALAEGDKPSVIARDLAERSGWPRREVYELITEMRESSEH